MYSPEIALKFLYNNQILLEITDIKRHLIGSYINIPDQNRKDRIVCGFVNQTSMETRVIWFNKAYILK